ncbi:YgfZ/GcvT domain-containing protein [Sphaerotilus sp.]|uniref:CAF17-like 4Fe-4S cluster assembly/insertion protein YgfZ n=1 Tax=Sphaerotilus sp. TaxID=2093942 RepID=UPI0025FA93F4|nr:folate-binding protein [Sphaerotilus sp.]
MDTTTAIPAYPDSTSTADTAPQGACLLPDWGVIRAVGSDAATFLHGQLSNDVSRLGLAQARLGAYCTPQGRMLASFVYARPGAEEFWLACSADVLPPTLKRLSMFVMRAKAKLTDASAELSVLGLAGSTAAAWLGADAPQRSWDKLDRDGAVVIRLPDSGLGRATIDRWLWIGPVVQAAAVLAALPALAPAVWQRLEVRSGVVPVVAQTSGQFVPQMLNYELVGGVDFKKGCYPGQEIVARSHYLGKLKRRAFLLAGEAAMVPAQEVFWSEDPGQPSGMVARAATDGPHHLGLAELKIAVTRTGTLHLGQPDGPLLRVLPLPYALPHDTEPA